MKFPIAALLALLPALLAGQSLAEDVLKGADLQGIVFSNYIGPHKVIESRLAIQGIGLDLGRQIKGGADAADYGGKYRIQRLNDAASPLLGADLLVLGPTAGVDHIRNLNWIVSAYVQQAFGYTVADGDLLADFITRYNAYYRGKAAYFPTVYADVVTSELVPPEHAGLALDYRDWPGKTLLLIPLRNSLSKGEAGGVNTEEISNKAVVTDMGTDQAALDARKKLADLKEGEIVQEQKTIAQKEAQLTAPAASSGQTPKTNSSDPQTSATTPGAASSPAASSGSPAAAGATASTAGATTSAAQLTAAKAELAQRDQALQAERKDIVAAEQKKAEPLPVPAVPVKPTTTVALVSVQDSTKLGQVVLVDPTANKVWKTSELNTVRQGRVQAFGDGLLVIAGDAKGPNGAVRLVLLNKDDLSVVATGTDDVSPDATLVVNGSQALTLAKTDKGQWVAGLFDAKLKAVAKGTDPLQASTTLVVAGTAVFAQALGGKFVQLDLQTLKKKSDTEN